MSFQKDDSFDANAYVKVNERLKDFWEKFPHGKLATYVTELTHGLLVKASLESGEDEGASTSASGHAYLDYEFMDEKVLEYTETVAVGRALAMMGFRVDKAIASAEEMDRFHEMKGRKAKGEGSDAAPAPSNNAKLKPASKFNLSGFKKGGAQQ